MDEQAVLKVGITGAGSPLARSIIPLLDADEGVSSILALDNRPYAGIPAKKLRTGIVDIRDADGLRRVLAGIDAVIHLAFIVRPDKLDKSLLDGVNIRGSQNAALAAAAVGARKLIYTSSVSAYGAVPGQPALISEDTPLRGEENERNFFYPYAKAVVERFLDGFAAAHPSLTVTRFRPHILTGPNYWRHSKNLFVLPNLTKRSRTMWGFRPQGPDGLLVQYTHEEDLAHAIHFALGRDLPGAYNIAGEPFDMGRFLEAQGRRFQPLPWRTLDRITAILGPFSGRARVARQWLVGARYRNILDCSKLGRAGFEGPLRTSLDCILEVNALARRKRQAPIEP